MGSQVRYDEFPLSSVLLPWFGSRAWTFSGTIVDLQLRPHLPGQPQHCDDRSYRSLRRLAETPVAVGPDAREHLRQWYQRLGLC